MNGYRGEWREVRGERNADKRRKIKGCRKIDEVFSYLSPLTTHL